jgi:hypothetical protein
VQFDRLCMMHNVHPLIVDGIHPHTHSSILLIHVARNIPELLQLLQ